MEVRWTDRQTDAIEIGGDTLLVSAGAGSGKTAVLVERLLRKIEDESLGADIDSFLVLTFANAAAAEMKEKIALSLERKLKIDPQNEFLRRQLVLLHNARISTIHSFCSEIVRENFQLLDIAPDFKIADENELELIMSETLSRVFDLFYETEGNEGFIRFLDMFSSLRGDEGARALVLSLYKKLIGNISFDGSLSRFAEMFRMNIDTPLEQTVWGKIILAYTGEVAGYLIKVLKKHEGILNDADEKLKNAYLPSIRQDIGQMAMIRKAAEDGSFDRVCACIQGYESLKLGSARGFAEDPAALGAKAAREVLKKHIRKLKEEIFYMESSGFMEDIVNIRPVIETVCSLLRRFSESFWQEKKRRNLCDFNDLEHLALKVLSDDEGNRSEAARNIANRFCEIMVDEYQDTNEIQDKIFSLISRDEKNIFMVGDVKQSIYKFRLARPDLFLQKYLRFGRDKECPGPKKVSLNSNFRSRREIIDLVNLLFSDLMSEGFGDIDYTKEEHLQFGSSYYSQNQDGIYKPELMILDLPPVKRIADEEEEETEGESPSNDELEAMLVARRIRELVDSGFLIYDTKKGVQRPAKFSDIVILMRSVEGRAPLYEKIFSDFGIPVYSGSFDSYFGTTEVMTMFALLKVLDNPLQDIPLVSVMRSPIFSFSEDEILAIRGGDKKAYLFDQIKVCAGSGSQKCAGFVEQIEKYRRFGAHYSTDRLIWYIYEDTGYYEMAGAMKNAEQCRLNLRMFFEYARYYESTTYRGLYNFIHFVNKIVEKKGDFAGVKLLSSNSDAVNIMSIHKSKGLEFPVCFLSQTGSTFNYTDLKSPMIFDAELGFGPQYRDTERKINYPTVAKRALMIKNEEEMLSEELRILYVALTRAKEKLIITGQMRELADKVFSMECVSARSKDVFDPVMLRYGRPSYLKWILQSLSEKANLANRISAGEKEIETGSVIIRLFDTLHITCPKAQTGEAKEDFDSGDYRETPLYRKATEILRYRYPHECLSLTPAKLSVTELKGKMIESELLEHTDIREKFLPATFKTPDFWQEDDISPARKGTAAHLVMQYIDYDRARTKEDIESEIARLVEGRFISEKDGNSVDRDVLLRFFASDMAERIRKARKVWREERFNLGVSRSEIFGQCENRKDDEKIILIQGVIDCFFEEKDGKVVLLDYKTDKLTAGDRNEIIIRYGNSMRFYKKAIEKIFQKEVKEIYIFLLNTSEAVSL